MFAEAAKISYKMIRVFNFKLYWKDDMYEPWLKDRSLFISWGGEGFLEESLDF